MKYLIYSMLFICMLLNTNCKQSKTEKGRPQFPEKISISLYKKECSELKYLVVENKRSSDGIDSAANQLIFYIDSQKAELLRVANQADPNLIEIKWNESMTNIDSLYSYISITNTLIGAVETNPINGKWSARELRTKLESFKNKIAASDSVKPAFNLIDCSDTYQDGVALTWEIHSFYHMPLIECLRTLTEEQIEIKKIAIALRK